MREAPRMIVAYTDDDGRKAYVHKRQAYYAIAKAMVVAKYPAWLNEGRGAAGRNATLPDGWTPKLVLLRQRKSYDLFWSEEGQGDDDIFGFRAFDSMKWKRFVRRVARFLEFVDDRRGATAGLTEDKLQAQYEYAENKAAMFAELARKTLGELQLRIDARYRGAS